MYHKFINTKPISHIEFFEENGTDTEKFYKKNKKKFGKEWYFFDKKISYVLNEQNFRSRSFEEVKWEDSIVLIGCSNVKGTGHAIEDTIGYRLEKILNIPVVNLGISGAGIDLACWNSLILYEHYPTPKAVVHIWSGLDRYTEYDGKNPKLFTVNKNNYCLKHNWDERSKLYIKSDNMLWKNKTIYYQATMMLHTAKNLSVDFYDQIDNARDLCHPGVESYKLAAQGIAENLIKQGLSR